MMSILIHNDVYANYSNPLHYFNQPWLSPAALQEYSAFVHEKGAPLQNCFGFIDGTVRPLCRPGEHQMILAVTPNGLISNLYGPVEGRDMIVACLPNLV